MIALDTNVLVRLLTDDDKAQVARSLALIERAIAKRQQLFVSDVVLCETVWVMRFAYGFERSPIAAMLDQLLQAEHLAFRDGALLRRALAGFVAGRGDFADYVIQQHAFAAGCEHVATFERALLKEKAFRSP